MIPVTAGRSIITIGPLKHLEAVDGQGPHGSAGSDDRQGVIPVFYHPDVEVCIKVIQACANGGAKCIEFTNRGDFAAHVFLEVTRHFAKADPSVIMGVGSMVDAPTAGIFIANGARFVVGPILNPDVAKVCNRRKIPYSPGCGSASEIGSGRGAGLRDRQGVSGRQRRRSRIRQGRPGPLPWTRIMPTGGVDMHGGVAEDLVRRRHRVRSDRLQPHHQGTAGGRTMPA